MCSSLQDDTTASNESQERIDALLKALQSGDSLSGEDPNGKSNGYQVPAHLKDLQEADLPENQRGIVLSEIAQFRERAMKKEKEKTERERLAATGSRDVGYGGRAYGNGGPPPSGPANRPRERVWGKPQDGPPQQPGSWGQNRNPGFVRGSEDVPITGPDKVAGETEKTDDELERERKLARERQEEHSFRDVSTHR